MSKIPRKDKPADIRFEIGAICISIKIEDAQIKEGIRAYYRDYLSHKKPDISINVEDKNFLKPNLNTVFLKTRSFQSGKDNGRFFLYFPRPDRPSLARFNTVVNKVEFYTQDNSGSLLFYLLPRAN